MAKKDAKAAPKPPKPAKAGKGGGGAKAGGPSFLLAKGDKIVFAAGVVMTLLLLAFGVSTLTSAKSPDDMIKKLNNEAERVSKEVANDQTGDVPPLPQWVKSPAGLERVASVQFPLVGPPFEPVHQPNMLRENPRVLTPFAWQIDTLRAPMRSLDIYTDTDGQKLIGVLAGSPVKEADRDKIKQAVGNLYKNQNTVNKRTQRKTVNPQQPGGQTQPGVPVASGGMPQPTSADGSVGGVPGGQRDDQTVKYLTPEEAQKGQYPLAETVTPLQAVLVHAVFPVNAQLEEIKRALRLRNAQEALTEAQSASGPRPPTGVIALGGEGGPAPPPAVSGGPVNPSGTAGTLGNSVGIQFAGFDVERRVVTPSGQDLGWAPFNHEDEYFTKIRAQKIADEADQGYLLPFLRYDQRMAAPLPQLAENLGKYPSIRIPAIVEAIRKMQAEGVTVPTPTDFENRFKNSAGDANPYAPFSGGVVGAGLSSGSPAPGVGMGAARPGGFGGETAVSGGRPVGGSPTGPGGVAGAAALPDVDNTLIRFIDPAVDAGYTYQYKIRVKMRNPNFGKTTDVQRKSDAAEEFLTGPWWTIPETVTLPSISRLYAYETGDYLKKAEELVKEVGNNVGNKFRMNSLLETKEINEGKRAVMQVQLWLKQVRATGDRSEPIGTWVAAEMPVAPGEYVGKRQLIKLPLWSSAAHGYVLRELAGGVKVAKIDDKNQPKGWPITFRTNPPILLVDFDGGQVKKSFNNKEIKDDSATELLLLGKNGKLMVRNSAEDMADPERSERDKTWTEWIDRVKTRKEVPATGTTGSGTTSGFNRNN